MQFTLRTASNNKSDLVNDNNILATRLPLRYKKGTKKLLKWFYDQSDNEIRQILVIELQYGQRYFYLFELEHFPNEKKQFSILYLSEKTSFRKLEIEELINVISKVSDKQGWPKKSNLRDYYEPLNINHNHAKEGGHKITARWVTAKVEKVFSSYGYILLTKEKLKDETDNNDALPKEHVQKLIKNIQDSLIENVD